MREIKFRAWDRFKKKMYSFEELDEKDMYNDINFYSLLKGEYSEVKAHQYTGLKDYHGAEIYEGDILFRQRTYRNKNGTKGKVEFKNSTCMLIDKEGATPLSNIAFNTEILGNIYENHELLEVSTE